MHQLDNLRETACSRASTTIIKSEVLYHLFETTLPPWAIPTSLVIMFSPLFAIFACIMLIATTEAFQRPSTYSARKLQATQLTMVSGNKANFGLFSPAVVAAKFVLGEAKLNKVWRAFQKTSWPLFRMSMRHVPNQSSFIWAPHFNGHCGFFLQ